jgi:hypothetical protein
MSRLNRIKVPRGKVSGDNLYTPSILSDPENKKKKYHRVFPSLSESQRKSLIVPQVNQKDSNEYDQYQKYQRSVSQLSKIIKHNGIPSPLKWHVKSRRIIRMNSNNSENSEYIIDPNEMRQKRSQYSNMSGNPSQRSHSSMDINDIDGARPQPQSFIQK